MAQRDKEVAEGMTKKEEQQQDKQNHDPPEAPHKRVLKTTPQTA